jgi:hypothetical protein
LWGNLAKLGIDPDEEKRRNRKALNARFVIPQTFRAIDSTGQIKGRWKYYLHRLTSF